jgi:hypothetical protein
MEVTMETTEWKFIDPTGINPEVFGLNRVFACKVKPYDCQSDENIARTRGWELFADLVEICPINGRKLEESTWYLFAAQGQS